MKKQSKGLIFNIQHFSTQDGPGIRTTVFLKGCPLSCCWCSNPESQAKIPELGFNWNLCDGCGKCIAVCSTNAISVSIHEGKIDIDRSLCGCCGKCIAVCHVDALKIFGKLLTASEVLHEVKRDRLFYRNSGGGVTLSGGEPLMQGQRDFAMRILRRCKEIGITTCVDTCGHIDASYLQQLLELEYVNLFLYDLKVIDNIKHQKFVGVSNRLILDNAKIIANSRAPMIIRVPLIPGITNSRENIISIANFVRDLETVNEIDLLPYHRFGSSKYEMIGRSYQLAELETCSRDEIEEFKRIIVDDFNFQCSVGG